MRVSLPATLAECEEESGEHARKHECFIALVEFCIMRACVARATIFPRKRLTAYE